jgi:hypothetical protein
VLARRTVPLLLAVAALAAGCARRPSAARDPHAAVACVGCHRALPADTGRGPVPDIACTSSGCHAGGGTDSAHLATVTFAHKRHPDGRGGSAGCATCHRHVPGSVAMVADTSACALCHVKDLTETRSRQPDCRSCHAHPRHSPETSQGVPISHVLLDVEKVPCTRCHYQVSEGTPTAVGKCQGCHRDSTVAAVRNADSLHASHRSYGCGACHAPVRHRVVAMSSSVSLACRDCHAPGHRRRIPADTSSTASCSDCHQEVHAEEQRLILGLLPGEPIRPSPMFMGGVTCRSCHVAPGRPGPAVGRPLVSNEAACTGCHGAQWSGILGRWRRGYERRSGWVNGYLAAAARVFADSARPAAARAQVRQAQSLLAFLQAAGALHNLPATDRIMRHALELASRAYREAGMTPPPVPELGPPVRTGTCMSCHYGIEEVQAVRDSTTGRPLKHADHLFRAYLPCDACHAVGAAPPGLPDSLWIDTTRLDRGGPVSRRRSPG